MNAKQKTDWLLNALIETRKSMGLRQKDVAQKMGIGQPAVSELESGNTAPKFETLLRYAEAVDCRIGFTLWANGKEYGDEQDD